MAQAPEVDADSIEAISEILERIVQDRGLLASLPEPVRRRFLIAAGRVSKPAKHEIRRLSKASHRQHKAAQRQAREEQLRSTGIRQGRREKVFQTPVPGGDVPKDWQPIVLDAPRNCYVCKEDFTKLHFFYDQLCPGCAEFNWKKRHQTADLKGRTALLTGGRVKIGYQTGILLLRAGATLVVTTRFPKDAASRYAQEEDFSEWGDRLSIHGLDLRHTPSVEAFAQHMHARYEFLDVVIHNACQTVRRPSAFYQHLLKAEEAELSSLPKPVQGLLQSYQALVKGASLKTQLATKESAPVGLLDAPGLSQLALLEEDTVRGGGVFPAGALDQDLQQIDLRKVNSWRLGLSEVSTVELLEVLLVNATAPFVLNARLKSLMQKRGTRDAHIVNVSAVEGQFYRSHKTDKHPHTNMAKAALNMMTRTSAQDFVKSGIHMNSVDTGWVTDEDPAHITQRKKRLHAFSPPLDIVDGAARIVDPIFHGMNHEEHIWGKFLKDYRETKW